jgi:hypothetical protein
MEVFEEKDYMRHVLIDIYSVFCQLERSKGPDLELPADIKQKKLRTSQLRQLLKPDAIYWYQPYYATCSPFFVIFYQSHCFFEDIVLGSCIRFLYIPYIDRSAPLY